ncbi:hypothetical protein CHGG_08923 [Chaetomium globosum CBS 148.51]|uniref:Zn(2)-C6 fungal-type domain-containing protein n=1 Tax=Chaetomium globosum (strain ATCC 6205 / CBS 148.51 / DSM 1962 / NBRC 6347 / NRRL 1970) TaxID=306901 RepID=Q2GSY1_CHAGB|nr:uncharacterized protein CHGG_08923 [Chaetomium globosum CBS 148.51]EAQ84909.1 hypothetical protein CHGG_08923 [Chaetomium globosum CBS 148.51]
MTAASSPSTKKSIRPHRKSRGGCGLCKRRKVKCNEEKPCSNCVSFSLPCDLAPGGTRVEYSKAPGSRPPRGRPRKVWSGESASLPAAHGHKPAPTTCRSETDSSGTPSQSPSSTATPSSPAFDADRTRINLDNAELLLHFVTTTAETFAGGEDTGMHRFWARNTPQMGLSHPFVLHLILASAAFHLAYVATKKNKGTESGDDNGRHQTPSAYLSLARQHLTAGVSGFSAQLSRPGPDNCGALYLGAVLTSYCTFAAGSTSRDDLLVCTASDMATPSTTTASASPGSWMPFVSGVRLMHESFRSEVLFAGLMAPFRTGSLSGQQLEQPVYARDGFPRLDWEGALDGLRGFIAAANPDGESPRTATASLCLAALDALIAIYSAIYGRRLGPGNDITHAGPSEDQFVFGWLYRAQPEFVACVRKRELHALLVLAHYAVLLNTDTIPGGWYIEGWREHIVARVGELVKNDGECSKWIGWPVAQAVPNGESGSGSGRRKEGELVPVTQDILPPTNQTP